MTHRFAAGSAYQPKGLAFAVDDLLRMKTWADRQGIRMVIRLDHYASGEEYEEVVAFHTDARSACFLLIWRSAEAVVVQPSAGRPLAYRSISHLLQSLVAGQDAQTTDTATRQ